MFFLMWLAERDRREKLERSLRPSSPPYSASAAGGIVLCALLGLAVLVIIGAMA